MPTLAPETAIPGVESPVARIARPAEEIRAWIVGELSRSLNVHPSTIDTSAPLDSLGVDSLAAIGMAGGLAGWLNRDLPATLMWDYPTIDAIAQGLGNADAPEKSSARPGVIDFQPLGDRLPIFFFPGVGGHPVTFAPLAAHLGPEQPCYGLTVPGIKGECTPLTQVEEIAAAMLKNLRRVQARGPYQLAGYSFGGLLAYETARQLADAGESVSMLAIYDMFTPAGRTVRPLWQRLALHAYLLTVRPGRLRYLRDRWKRLRPSRKPEVTDVERDHTADTDDPNEKIVARANSRASANYRPRPYPGSVLVFRATDRGLHNFFFKMDPRGGWGDLAAGGVRVVDLPGSHYNLLDADHAPAAAQRLRPFLSDKTHS
jgi:thioesterase domain-containing protein/acyl carrier protein